MAEFVETSILLAVLGENDDEAVRLVGLMLPGERQRFRRVLVRTADLVDQPYMYARPPAEEVSADD